MSFVSASTETVAAAATDASRIGSSLLSANAAAASATTSVLAAGADEISAALAALFSGHGQAYQGLSARMMAFHDRFVQTLDSTATMCVRRKIPNPTGIAASTCWGADPPVSIADGHVI